MLIFMCALGVKSCAFKRMCIEESLGQQEIKPVSPKGNQPWIFTGRTDAEVEAPVFWLPDAKSRRIGQDTDAGKGEGATEDKMVG